ncbi:MAG: phosphatase PAP2 family protein [Desulfurococcaceae archaeon]
MSRGAWLNKALAAAALAAALGLLLTIAAGNLGAWKAWSALGSEEFYMVAAVAAYYFAPSPYQGLALVLAVLLSGSLNVALKYSLNAPRPPNPLIEVEGPGFPSGHAQVSASFWSSASMLAKKPALAALSAVIVAGVSLSRLYLRAHYEVDVVGGVLLGLAAGYLAYRAYSRHSRSGSLSAYYAIASAGALLSLVNLLLLKGDLEASPVLLGMSLALLTAIPLLGRKIVEARQAPLATRILLCTALVPALLATHVATLSGAAPLRAAAFYAAGLLVYSGPLLASKISQSRGQSTREHRGSRHPVLVSRVGA